MQKLTANIRLAAEAHPTQTILRDTNAETNQQYLDVVKLAPGRKIPLPDNFDGRQAWKGLITEPMDQGKCGSCWAFASVGSLSDRFNIQSLGLLHVELSPTALILCSWGGAEIPFFDINSQNNAYETTHTQKTFNNSACFGNTLVDACRYLYQIGTPTLKCVPYDTALGTQAEYQKIGNFTEPAQLPSCSAITGPLYDMCAGSYIDYKTGVEYGEPLRFYRSLHFYGVAGVPADNGSELYIRDNIYKWGPIATGMKVYPDFYTFDSKRDIYKWNGQGEQIGGHAIVLVGWGTRNNQDYWIVRNSWGKSWGENGYFLMARGVNECEIEANCLGQVPDFFYPLDTAIIKKNGRYIKNDTIYQGRLLVHNFINTKAGGIDPNTGYTRRVEIQMPWLDLSRPVNLKDLPDWRKFVAGTDALLKNRVKYQASIKTKTNYTEFSNQLLLLYLFLFTIIVMGIIWLIIRKKRV